MRRVAIVGTGLIGASVGLALKAAGFDGEIVGWDANAAELAEAQRLGAVDVALVSRDAVAWCGADVFVLATPVLPILDWMQVLAPVLGEEQWVTDVGSTKSDIAKMATELFNQPGRARFFPGHPMAGKESGGAALAEAGLFRGAMWLFCPVAGTSLQESEWCDWVKKMGAAVKYISVPEQHDEVCAWVSHLPQMLSTALAALLQDTFADNPAKMEVVQAVGGRALRETTRLGASPYSMWRDIALTNTEEIAKTLHALEQRLAHVRENLRTPELREEFATANKFRAKK